MTSCIVLFYFVCFIHQVIFTILGKVTTYALRETFPTGIVLIVLL